MQHLINKKQEYVDFCEIHVQFDIFSYIFCYEFKLE